MPYHYFVRQLSSETQPVFKRLALEWRVFFEVWRGETICLDSNPHSRTHTLFINNDLVSSMEQILPILVTYLCRAKLAETIDSAFATLRIASPWPWYSLEAHMLFSAWKHTDLWANDLRHRLFPYFSQRGRISSREFQRRVTVYAPCEPPLMTPFAVVTALEIAERRRYRLVSRVDPYTIIGSSQLIHLVKELVTFYESPSLDPLPSDKTGALKRLEDSVGEACVVLGFPFRPTMTRHDGISQWRC
ncbi:MAG: hypothetical protein ACFFFG_11865 [Candidatus Thorarchaeota archaeon]